MAVCAPAAHAETTLGLYDDHAFNDFRGKQRRAALSRADQLGAGMVRFTIDWSLVAPEGAQKPSGFEPAKPDDANYRWGYVDEFVRDAKRRGVRVLFTVVRAPAWAEGPGRPSGAPPGTWMPDPDELGAFIKAAAIRYSGFFPDPQDDGGLQGPGSSLPAVRSWQVWDAPNSGRRLRASGGTADWYRGMLAASARSLKAVDPDNVVVTGGTVASADRNGVPPTSFWRRLMCLESDLDRDRSCTGRARFDRYAHNPVLPGRSPRLRRLVLAARRAGTIRSPARPSLWVTSLSGPARPLGRQARYLTEALYELTERQHVPVVIWRGLRDHGASGDGHFARIDSGLYTSDDVARPVAAAFRFPFLVRRSRAWGIRPAGGRRQVRIQQRRRGRWIGVAQVRACGGCAFEARLDSGRGRFRAVSGPITSRPWRT